MRTVLLSFLCCAALSAADFPPVFSVKTYGAVGDKKTLDTTAIQKAIDACNKAGGGVVYFPAGNFLSGTIFLKSNVTLYLSPGAVLWGSSRMSDYNPKHLIYAKGVENIAIEGGGAIDGQGDLFLDKDLKPLPRPSPLIEIWDSKDIRIQDVTIRKAPAWTIHPKNCDRVKIRGISILNNVLGINTDGIDPDSSRNVIIADSYIEAGDDCIVLKTTKRGEGPVQPIENVTVTNCVLISAASALKLGTESHADFRHCTFSNCVIRNSRTGIALLAKDGGVMEDIHFSNITMQTAPKWGKGVEWPIVLDIEKRNAESRISRIRDVTFNGITLYTKGRILAEGMLESPLETISFRNILMRVTGEEKVAGVKKLKGGTTVNVDGTPDYGSVPAAMIFAHIKGLSLNEIEVVGNAPERKEMFTDNVSGLKISAPRR
jgi:polygalacturonase